MIALGLIAAAVLCVSACGDDDDSDADTSAAAVAPSPDEAFRDFSAAVEGQGMVVSNLPAGELHGAEAGRRITGDKSGTALLFKTEGEAKDYADEVSQSGKDKTATVGTVVLVAPTQADADFFADAYEGG
jgi:hypothetical protein